jgi:hypothetical protein
MDKVSKKRRDDDDEEEEPVQKKRKKKKKSGGVPEYMIALVVVGVLAIGGIAIWLLSGDPKKKDTASSSDSNPSSSKPSTPNVDEGLAPSISKKPKSKAGAALAWQRFSAEGFSAEMPGIPTVVDRAKDPNPTDERDYSLDTVPHFEGFTIIIRRARYYHPDDPSWGKKSLEETATAFEYLYERANIIMGVKLKMASKNEIKQDGFLAKDYAFSDRDGGQGGCLLRIVQAGAKIYILSVFAVEYSGFESHAKRFMNSVKITGEMEK